MTQTSSDSTTQTRWVDSHGYEYKNAADCLLRKKADTIRNSILEAHYQSGFWKKDQIESYLKAYDAAEGTHTEKHLSGCTARSKAYGGQRGSSTASSVPSSDAAFHSAIQPQVPSRMGPQGHLSSP